MFVTNHLGRDYLTTELPAVRYNTTMHLKISSQKFQSKSNTAHIWPRSMLDQTTHA